MIPRRFWSGLSFWVALCILFSLYFLWTHVSDPSSVVAPVGQNNPPPDPEVGKEKDTETEAKEVINKDGKLVKDGKTYKDFSKEKTYPPIEDNFPWGNSMQSRKDFPKIPSWNRPPATHVKEKTPLFIGFTRTVCTSQLFLTAPSESFPLPFKPHSSFQTVEENKADLPSPLHSGQCSSKLSSPT
jgi:hypothetical protein